MTSRRTRRFSCEVEFALDVLGGKWKAVILALLKERPRPYGELRRRVPRLSDRMLSQRLADLQSLGFIERRKVGRRGAPSEYRLTRRGNTLAGTPGPVRLGHDDGQRSRCDHRAARLTASRCRLGTPRRQ